MKTGNFNDIGLCILNDVLFNKESDGMVLLSSQSKIESKVECLGSSKIIYSTHSILKTPSYANQLLDIVNNNMSNEEINKKL